MHGGARPRAAERRGNGGGHDQQAGDPGHLEQRSQHECSLGGEVDEGTDEKIELVADIERAQPMQATRNERAQRSPRHGREPCCARDAGGAEQQVTGPQRSLQRRHTPGRRGRPQRRAQRFPLHGEPCDARGARRAAREMHLERRRGRGRQGAVDVGRAFDRRRTVHRCGSSARASSARRSVCLARQISAPTCVRVDRARQRSRRSSRRGSTRARAVRDSAPATRRLPR